MWQFEASVKYIIQKAFFLPSADPSKISTWETKDLICENQTNTNIPSGCIKVAFDKIIKGPHMLFFCEQYMISNALEYLKRKETL